jgi:hypothetical protein
MGFDPTQEQRILLIARPMLGEKVAAQSAREKQYF